MKDVGEGNVRGFVVVVMWLLVGCPCSGGWPSTHAHMGNTDVLSGVEKETKRSWRGMVTMDEIVKKAFFAHEQS